MNRDVRMSDLIAANPAFEQQMRDWQNERHRRGESPFNWPAFRSLTTFRVGQDPGIDPPDEFFSFMPSDPPPPSVPNRVGATADALSSQRTAPSPGQSTRSTGIRSWYSSTGEADEEAVENNASESRQTSAPLPELRARLVEVVDRVLDVVSASQVVTALNAETDADLLAAIGLSREDARVESGIEGHPLAPARARGEQAKRDILASQGDLLDVHEVAARLGIDDAEVDRRYQDGRLLALPARSGKPGFPTWQFTDSGLLPGLEDVLSHMSVRSAWMRAQFFLTGDLRLDCRTPLEALLSGEIDAVRRAAAAYGEQLAS
jgi:hypothetical protein